MRFRYVHQFFLDLVVYHYGVTTLIIKVLSLQDAKGFDVMQKKLGE
jgi:hypothetical protein